MTLKPENYASGHFASRETELMCFIASYIYQCTEAPMQLNKNILIVDI